MAIISDSISTAISSMAESMSMWLYCQPAIAFVFYSCPFPGHRLLMLSLRIRNRSSPCSSAPCLSIASIFSLSSGRCPYTGIMLETFVASSRVWISSVCTKVYSSCIFSVSVASTNSPLLTSSISGVSGKIESPEASTLTGDRWFNTSAVLMTSQSV